MRFKVRTRLTLWYVTLTAVILAVWIALSVTLVNHGLYDALDRTLTARAVDMVVDLRSHSEEALPDAADPSVPGLRPGEVAAQLLSTRGTVLEFGGITAASTPMLTAHEVQRISASSGSYSWTLERAGRRFRALAVRRGSGGPVLVVAASSQEVDSAWASLLAVMLVTGPIMLVVAAIGGRWLADQALSPVANMTATAAAIRGGLIRERVAVPPGEDEFTDLANTLNSMLSRLETDIEDKRRLIADASHELQTPLAVMRTEMDVALAAGGLPKAAVEVLESAREETDRMAQTVRNLLTLARLDEGGLRLLRGPLDLHVVVGAVATSVMALAEDRGVKVTVEGQTAIADADGEYIRQALLNIVENAIEYSGRGRSATIRVRTSPGWALVDVSDDGPGIPAEALGHIFDRFYRVEASRSRSYGGSGLGLAISQGVVEAHGGRIDVVSSPDEGSTFTIWLPAAG
jgi:signal transduction histidine kinase